MTEPNSLIIVQRVIVQVNKSDRYKTRGKRHSDNDYKYVHNISVAIHTLVAIRTS